MTGTSEAVGEVLDRVPVHMWGWDPSHSEATRYGPSFPFARWDTGSDKPVVDNLGFVIRVLVEAGMDRELVGPSILEVDRVLFDTHFYAAPDGCLFVFPDGNVGIKHGEDILVAREENDGVVTVWGPTAVGTLVLAPITYPGDAPAEEGFMAALTEDEQREILAAAREINATVAPFVDDLTADAPTPDDSRPWVGFFKVAGTNVRSFITELQAPDGLLTRLSGAFPKSEPTPAKAAKAK